MFRRRVRSQNNTRLPPECIDAMTSLLGPLVAATLVVPV
jgi:hypothetical protein